jgi:hypothetical protein
MRRQAVSNKKHIRLQIAGDSAQAALTEGIPKQFRFSLDNRGDKEVTSVVQIIGGT